MFSILIKEINEFLNSLIAYMSLTVFLIGVGLVMWVFPDTNIFDFGYASMSPLFSLGPYIFMFLIPAITMRSFAEEKRNGTIELLYTLPLNPWEILIGKYLASWVLASFALIPTFLYYYCIWYFGYPQGNLDTPGIIGSYIGLFLLAGVFTSLGIFSSAISDNQIVSFVLAAFSCFIFYQVFESLASIDIWGSWSYYLERLGIVFYYNALSKGLLDGESIAYFLGFIIIILSLTQFFLNQKRS